MKSKQFDETLKSLLTEIGHITCSISPESVSVENMVYAIINYYESIIGSMPGNVYWLDKEGIAVGCNKNVLDMFGLTKMSQFKGIDFERMGVLGNWSPTAVASFKHDTLQVILTGKPILNVEEPPIPHADGRVLHFLTHRVPLYDKAKNIVGVVGISIDISERKKLEEDLRRSKIAAEAASQAKTEFLENMRHDIRTPLTGIVGFADILKAEASDYRIREYADNLVASSHALLDLLDEVLEAIRVSSGEIPLMKKKFNLEHTLRNIIQLNRAKANEKRLDLSLNFDKNIPSFVVGDKIRIHRIALELVTNALNFTDKGFVKLSVTLAKKDDRKLIIKIAVEDSGIGIPKDKQQEIYLQFKRLTPSYKGIYKGSGLGLFVIKQFIDELGGEIYVESEPQKNTTFTCVIPLQEALLNDNTGVDYELENNADKLSKTTLAPKFRADDLGSATPHQHSALVVEDSLIAQAVAKSIISQFNCSVDVATDGKAAIELWNKNHYDIVFMDIGLPDMDGYEVARRIRAQESAHDHLPIIALTAHIGEENTKQCIEAGMNAVLNKPLTQKHCSDIMDTFIPGRKKVMHADSLNLSPDMPDSDDVLFMLDDFPLLHIENTLNEAPYKNMLTDFLKLMVEQALPEDIAKLEEAHANGNWINIQQITHKIKGGAVYLGTIRMKMACLYLERYWKAGQNTLLEKLYQQLIEVCSDTSNEITIWLASQKHTK